MRWVRVLGPEGRSPIAENPDADNPHGGDFDGSDFDGSDAGSAPEGAIIVTSDDGEKFALSLDDALRDAVSEGRSGGGEGADERPSDSAAAPRLASAPLTPREIQVRVRAGEAPDDLVDADDPEYERVMRFAFPVIEERLRIGDEARRSRARRDGDGALVPFADSVDSRFLAHGIDPASVSWDSFRRPDGTWVVTATWRGGRSGESERSAHWSFSLTARTVLAVDETASDLLSDRPLRPVVRAVPDHRESTESDQDDGDAGSEEVFDQEAPAGYRRAPERSRERARERNDDGARTLFPDVSGFADAPPLPLRLAEPLRDVDEVTVNRARPADGRGEDGPTGDDQDAVYDTDTIAFDELFSANLDSPDGGAESEAGHDQRRPGSAPPDTAADDSAASSANVSADSSDETPAPPTRGGGRSKAAREQTKIPSWDDILLGVRRKQD